MTITRTYTNNADNTAVVEHVTMTRREFDQALSVARETAYRAAADFAHRRMDAAITLRGIQEAERLLVWCSDMADEEAGSR